MYRKPVQRYRWFAEWILCRWNDAVWCVCPLLWCRTHPGNCHRQTSVLLTICLNITTTTSKKRSPQVRHIVCKANNWNFNTDKQQSKCRFYCSFLRHIINLPLSSLSVTLLPPSLPPALLLKDPIREWMMMEEISDEITENETTANLASSFVVQFFQPLTK